MSACSRSHSLLGTCKHCRPLKTLQSCFKHRSNLCSFRSQAYRSMPARFKERMLPESILQETIGFTKTHSQRSWCQVGFRRALLME